MDRAVWREVVVKVVAVFIRVATRTRHRLRREAIALRTSRGRGSKLRADATATRGGQAWVDSRHAESVWPGEGRWKPGIVRVLWWSGRLTVLAVPDIRGEAIDFFLFLARLHINELHFSLKTTSLLLEILVLELLFLKLLTISGSPRRLQTRRDTRHAMSGRECVRSKEKQGKGRSGFIKQPQNKRCKVRERSASGWACLSPWQRD